MLTCHRKGDKVELINIRGIRKMIPNYNLKSLRAKNNMNQIEMAIILDMTPTTYNRKENGFRAFTLEEAFNISKHFKVTIEEIF